MPHRRPAARPVRCKVLAIGNVLGRPATGRSFEITVMDVIRFADGKIVEHWGVPDQLGMLIQLGLFDGRTRRRPPD